MFDLGRFSLREMTELGRLLRACGGSATCLEGVANRVVSVLHENLIDGPTGERACALVRFFVTRSYQQVEEDAEAAGAWKRVEGGSIGPDTKCLSLVATAGLRPAWNRRDASVNHRIIPLYDAEAVREIPMISGLLSQLGIKIEALLAGERVILDSADGSFNVFHVEEARGSRWIPAQTDFVERWKIASVIGFGGALGGGEIFAVIIFSRVPIRRDTAGLFRTLGLSVKLATVSYGEAVAGSHRGEA